VVLICILVWLELGTIAYLTDKEINGIWVKDEKDSYHSSAPNFLGTRAESESALPDGVGVESR
jgi:hypothetical protein